MAGSSAWGIDIGQSALKAIKLQYVESTGQVMAAAFDYVQYPKILTQPDAVPEEIIHDAMKTFLSRNKLEGEQVAMAVPGQTSLTRFIQLPPVEAKKVHQIVQYEARQQIPFALEDVVWDYQRLGSGIEEGGFLLDAEVGLFAMKRDALAQAMRPYVQHKVELELIQIAPLALYNVLCYDELGQRPDNLGDNEDFVITLDMGCDNTTLMVSNGKKIWVRNVPIGGNHFTRALTKEMKLSFAKAELLKCNATKSEDPRAVFQALRPVFNDFVSEIQRSIGFFSSVNRQAKIAKVLGLGNGFKLAGLQKFLQQNLQYDVERPDVYKALAGDAVINSPLFADNVLSFAVPYGLALQLVGQTAIKTTLLPPEITRERVIRRKKPWAVATAATLLLGTAVATMGNAFPYSAVHTKEFQDAQDKATAFGGKVSSLKTNYETEKTNFEKQFTDLNAAIKGRKGVPWLELYSAINDCLPRDEGDAQAIELELRNQMNIEEITMSRVADLDAGWFQLLNENAKGLLAPDEKEKAPTGEGYVVTIRGMHWHHNANNPKDQSQPYISATFLKKLQSDTVEVPGFPPRDVRKMGISNATIVDYWQEQFRYDPDGLKIDRSAPRTNLFANAPVAGTPGAPGTPSAPGAGEAFTIEQDSGTTGASFPGAAFPGSPQGYPMGSAVPGAPGAPGGTVDPKQFKKLTRFIIQFAYKAIPPEERNKPEGEAGADGAPAEEKPAAKAAPAAE
jgi:type IV pilus assembly protein PilM